MEYLISIFGIEEFKIFYSSLKEDFKTSFSDIFKITLASANEKFIKYISSVGNNDAISNMIKSELEERNLLK